MSTKKTKKASKATTPKKKSSTATTKRKSSKGAATSGPNSLRPGWATTLRTEKNFSAAPPELWRRLHAELQDVGPDTFQESDSAPYVFYELLVKGEKYALIHSNRLTADSFLVFTFEEDPSEKFDAFYNAALDAVVEDMNESEDFE